jgi:ParB family chromosome partitioning protein
MLAAARIERNLLPDATLGSHDPIPEKHLRPLTSLEPERQREAWAQVEAENPAGNITGPKVQEIVDRTFGRLVRGPIGSYREKEDGTKQCEKCGQLWAADLDYCPYCNISRSARVLHAQRERQKTVHVAHNSGNNEWYTPPRFTDAAHRVMGDIDLDPASCAFANQFVKAKRYYSIEDDGLEQPWEGRVWMNPPYSGDLVPRFINKLVEHVRSGDITEACILVNNATETAWFQTALSVVTCMCLVKGRIKFFSVDGEPRYTGLQGQVVLYVGTNGARFAEEYGQFGAIFRARGIQQ